ncbi:MAG: FAD-dependent oxidoreductase [Saprospiraceae bacterium]|nr:FAD-dependent oxidoreductase [Saprospiraceae bacterium]
MHRQTHLHRLRTETFDLCIIGGGASGAGCALDAALRGLKVALVEKNDFAAETSSRSTKLIHGGVRYLEQAVKKLDFGQLRQVKHGLEERHILLANAPHLARPLPLLTPVFSRWEAWYFALGLKLYDWFAARKDTLPKSRLLSRREALERMPGLNLGIKGAVLYYDGQMDDARYCLALVQSAATAGAAVANHVSVSGFDFDDAGRLTGARLTDHLPDPGQTGSFAIKARLFLNCTGPFSDHIRQMANPALPARIQASKGAHIAIPQTVFTPPPPTTLSPTESSNNPFSNPQNPKPVAHREQQQPFSQNPTPKNQLPTPNSQHLSPPESSNNPFPNTQHPIPNTPLPALLIPKTPDGRVVFLVPYGQHMLLGTTDEPCPDIGQEPRAERRDLDFLLETLTPYLSRTPAAETATAGFAGLRPLIRAGGRADTKSLLRDHEVEHDARSGLYSLLGGKWTTYRLMARDAVDAVCRELGVQAECRTAAHRLAGAGELRAGELAERAARYGIDATVVHHLSEYYGDNSPAVIDLVEGDESLAKPLVAGFPFIRAEVVWAARREMACTLRDVLARRLRLEIADWQAAGAAAPAVAAILARELGWPEERERVERDKYRALLADFGAHLKTGGIENEKNHR